MLEEIANKNIDSFFFEIQENIMMVSEEYTQLLQRPTHTIILTFYSQDVGWDQRLQHIF